MPNKANALSLISHFSIIKDPRIERGKKHLLIDIFVIAICAVIGGADGWDDIVVFAKSKEDWFRRFLSLPNGIPCDDTIARVFQRIDPQEFRQHFIKWVSGLGSVFGKEVIAIDGKSVRRSHDWEENPLHMVSAFAVENSLVLGQVKVSEKSNEITAIPELLQMLDIKGCIVSIDAMGCQTEIATKIKVREGDYVLSLKGNQGNLHEEVRDFFTESVKDNFKEIKKYDKYETVEKEHGRIESRHYYVVSDIEWLSEKSKWYGLRSVAMVRSEREIRGKKSVEKRYYISSLPGNAKELAKAIRNHWGIENSLHWVLDMVFREDESRIRKGHGAENFVLLRHLALNLLKKVETKKKMSIRAKRLKSGWDNAFLQSLLNQLF